MQERKEMEFRTNLKGGSCACVVFVCFGLTFERWCHHARCTRRQPQEQLLRLFVRLFSIEIYCWAILMLFSSTGVYQKYVSRRFIDFRMSTSPSVVFSSLWQSFGRCSLAAGMSFYNTLRDQWFWIFDCFLSVIFNLLFLFSSFSHCSDLFSLLICWASGDFQLKRKDEGFLLSLTMRTECDHCQFIVSVPRMVLVARISLPWPTGLILLRGSYLAYQTIL